MTALEKRDCLPKYRKTKQGVKVLTKTYSNILLGFIVEPFCLPHVGSGDLNLGH